MGVVGVNRIDMSVPMVVMIMMIMMVFVRGAVGPVLGVVMMLREANLLLDLVEIQASGHRVFQTERRNLFDDGLLDELGAGLHRSVEVGDEDAGEDRDLVGALLVHDRHGEFGDLADEGLETLVGGEAVHVGFGDEAELHPWDLAESISQRTGALVENLFLFLGDTNASLTSANFLELFVNIRVPSG